jgi:hypothetical protein
MITREVVTYFNGNLLHVQPLSNAEYDTIQWDWHKEVNSLYEEALAIKQLANFTRAMGDSAFSDEEREKFYESARQQERNAERIIEQAEKIRPKVQLEPLCSEDQHQPPEQTQ